MDDLFCNFNVIVIFLQPVIYGACPPSARCSTQTIQNPRILNLAADAVY